MTTHIAALIAELRDEAADHRARVRYVIDSRKDGPSVEFRMLSAASNNDRAQTLESVVARLEAASAKDAEVTQALAMMWKGLVGDVVNGPANGLIDETFGARTHDAVRDAGLTIWDVFRDRQPPVWGDRLTPLGERALKLAEG